MMDLYPYGFAPVSTPVQRDCKFRAVTRIQKRILQTFRRIRLKR